MSPRLSGDNGTGSQTRIKEDDVLAFMKVHKIMSSKPGTSTDVMDSGHMKRDVINVN